MTNFQLALLMSCILMAKGLSPRTSMSMGMLWSVVALLTYFNQIM